MISLGELSRRSGTILSITALSWGFVQAPFLHIHAEDHDHPAASPVHVHYHVAGKRSTSTLDSDDDDAIDLQWSAVLPSGIDFHLDLDLPERLPITPATFSWAAILIPQHRGHDPPSFSPKQPRAPPV